MPYVFEHDDPRIVAQLAGNAGELATGMELAQNARANDADALGWAHLDVTRQNQDDNHALAQARLDQGDYRLAQGDERIKQAGDIASQRMDLQRELQGLRQAEADGRLTVRGQQRMQQLEYQAGEAAKRMEAGFDFKGDQNDQNRALRVDQFGQAQDGKNDRFYEGQNRHDARLLRSQNFREAHPSSSGIPQSDRDFRNQMMLWNATRQGFDRQIADLNAKAKIDFKNRDAILGQIEGLKARRDAHLSNPPELPRQVGPDADNLGDQIGPGASASPDGTAPTYHPAETGHLAPPPAAVAMELRQQALLLYPNDAQQARLAFETWLADAGFDPHSPVVG